MNEKETLFNNWVSKLPKKYQDDLFYLGACAEESDDKTGTIDINWVINKMISKIKKLEEKK